jgi:hypothetical protein
VYTYIYIIVYIYIYILAIYDGGYTHTLYGYICYMVIKHDKT